MKGLLKRTMRISAVQCNLGEDSFDILHRHTIGNGFNVEQLNHLFKHGFEGEFIEEKHGETLDKYLKDAHEAGVAVIVYFCLHELFPKDRDAHPEWLQQDRAGKFIPAYGSHYLGCLNSPWREYSVERIKQLCKHDIDGIFLDGPLFSVNGCYCSACRKLYKEKTGKEFLSASFSEFLDFRVESLTSFVKELREASQSVKDVPMYLNNSALRADIIGSNTRKLEPYVDLIGAEGGFTTATSESVYLTGAMAKEIEGKANGKPTVIFIAGDRKPYSFHTHTAADTTRMMAQTVANGANVWYGLHGHTSQMQTKGGEAAKKFLRFLKENEDAYADTESVANTALVWSVNTANYYSSKVTASDFTGDESVLGSDEVKGDHFEEFMGWYELLSRLHVSFDVVDERGFLENKEKYKCVILPSVACVEKTFAEGLKSYAKEGGNVVGSLLNGEYDEKGRAIEKNSLDELFGITGEGRLYREWLGTQYQYIDGKESLDIMQPLSRNVTLTTGKSLARKSEVMTGRYEPLTPPWLPSVIENEYGKGKAISCVGNLGQNYYQIRDEDDFECARRAIDATTVPMVETNAPRGVEITLRKQGDKYLLHLINLTGDHSPMTEFLPVYDIKFKLNIAGVMLGGAKIVGGENLQGENGEYRIPVLNDYLCVELK